jgi:hypothetical protein
MWHTVIVRKGDILPSRLSQSSIPRSSSPGVFLSNHTHLMRKPGQLKRWYTAIIHNNNFATRLLLTAQCLHQPVYLLWSIV